MHRDVFSMRIELLVLGICLMALVAPGLATLPSDAQVINLDENVSGYAPGAYYRVEISEPATLQVILDQVPAEMQTRIAIINEEGAWLASEDAASPGEKMTVEAAADLPGWYYIAILELSGKTLVDPYSFRVVTV
ncbi:MAG: hypothetical protein A4E49_00822 [Methanosaeta sp. PtaU1.Bin112]|nr:MAG: hypothetical protein A4E49_00822 [Methanosaeta sp. PtaU1.Bin112]